MKLALATFLAVLSLPTVGWAQPVDTFDRLAAKLKEGQGIDVIDVQGRRTTGDVVRVSPSYLTVRTLSIVAGGKVLTGVETFSVTAVRKVRRRDPLWNGGLIGAVTGAGVGALMVASCNNFCFTGPAIALTAGVGSAIGFVADGFYKPALYSQRHPAAAAVTPPIAIERRGVQIAWRW
jgi:hypothetical protein